MPLHGATQVHDPVLRLWCEVVMVCLNDAKRCPHVRWELSRPSEAIGVILTVLGIDPGFWRERCVPQLQAKWAKADARRAAHEQNLAIGLGGCGLAARRSEQQRKGWVTRRARLTASQGGRLATGDRPAKSDRRSTATGAALA